MGQPWMECEHDAAAAAAAQNDELHGSRRNRRWGFRGVLPGNRHRTSSHWARQLNSAVSLTEISVEQIPYSPLAGFSNPPPWVLEIFRLPHEYQMMTQH